MIVLAGAESLIRRAFLAADPRAFRVAMIDETGALGWTFAAPHTCDAFVLPATALHELPGDANPCAVASDVKTFPAGSYIVTAGVYVPGEQTPSVSTSIAVEVDGDVTATIDGTKLSK